MELPELQSRSIDAPALKRMAARWRIWRLLPTVRLEVVESAPTRSTRAGGALASGFLANPLHRPEEVTKRERPKLMFASQPQLEGRFARLPAEQSINRLFERSQVAIDGIEHAFHLDSEVLVRDQIAHADDIRPRDVGFEADRLGRQALHRLPDNDELKEKGVVEKLIITGG